MVASAVPSRPTTLTRRASPQPQRKFPLTPTTTTPYPRHKHSTMSTPKRRKPLHPQQHSTKLTTPTSTNRGGGTAALKKKVRDLERLLAHQTRLPADVVANNERALAAFRAELEGARRSAREGKMERRYQMVRFFEQKKAARRVKRLQKQLDEEKEKGGEEDELREKLKSAEVDLCYARYYPRGVKYIALFKDPGEQTKVREKREGIRREIERQMETGTLGSVTIAEEEEKGMEGEKRKGREEGGKDKKKRKKEAEKELEQEEEDAFFEF